MRYHVETSLREANSHYTYFAEVADHLDLMESGKESPSDWFVFC